MLKSLVFTLFVICAFGTSMHAQMGLGRPEDINAVKSRQLIVMIEEPRAQILKYIEKRKVKDKVSIEEYKADIDAFNTNMKEVLESYWPYNKSNIQYKTFEEIKALRKSGSKEFVVVNCISARASEFNMSYAETLGLFWTKNAMDFQTEGSGDYFTFFKVFLIEFFDEKPVFYTPVFDLIPSKAAIVFGIKNTSDYFTMRLNKKSGSNTRDERDRIQNQLAKRAPTLAQKTLLIRKDWLDPKLTEQMIKKVYPYKFKICTRDEMDAIVITYNEQYAYGVVFPYVMSGSTSNSIIFLHLVQDAKDGGDLAVVKPSTGALIVSSELGGAGKDKFTLKIFEKIVDQSKGKDIPDWKRY